MDKESYALAILSLTGLALSWEASGLGTLEVG